MHSNTLLNPPQAEFRPNSGDTLLNPLILRSFSKQYSAGYFQGHHFVLHKAPNHRQGNAEIFMGQDIAQPDNFSPFNIRGGRSNLQRLAICSAILPIVEIGKWSHTNLAWKRRPFLVVCLTRLLDEAAMRQTNGVPSHRLEVNHWPAFIAIFCQKRSCSGEKSATNEANFLGYPNRWIRPCCIFFNIQVACTYWMFPIPLDLYPELFFLKKCRIISEHLYFTFYVISLTF